MMMQVDFSDRDVQDVATGYLEAAERARDARIALMVREHPQYEVRLRRAKWGEGARYVALRTAEWFLLNASSYMLQTWLEHTGADAEQIGRNLWACRNEREGGFSELTRDLAPAVKPTLADCADYLTSVCERMGSVDQVYVFPPEDPVAHLEDYFVIDESDLLKLYQLSKSSRFDLGQDLYLEADEDEIALLRRAPGSDPDDDVRSWDVLRRWDPRDPTLTVRKVLDAVQPYLADAVAKAKRRW